VYLASLELRDFRRYETAHLELGPGVTVIEGLNGAGKTTLLEAVAWVALGRSFRHVPDQALVRDGCDTAIVRAAVEHDGRRQTLDAELRVAGRNRVVINGHPLTRALDRLDILRVTIFAGADQATSAEARDSFEAALTMAGVEHRFVTYDGAPHSFFDRKADEFADASAKAWEETLTFVRGHAPSPIGA